MVWDGRSDDPCLRQVHWKNFRGLRHRRSMSRTAARCHADVDRGGRDPAHRLFEGRSSSRPPAKPRAGKIGRGRCILLRASLNNRNSLLGDRSINVAPIQFKYRLILPASCRCPLKTETCRCSSPVIADRSPIPRMPRSA